MVEHVSLDNGCLLAELFFLIKRVERAELTGYYCCMRQRLKNINVDMVEHGPSDIGCFFELCCFENQESVQLQTQSLSESRRSSYRCIRLQAVSFGQPAAH